VKKVAAGSILKRGGGGHRGKLFSCHTKRVGKMRRQRMAGARSVTVPGHSHLTWHNADGSTMTHVPHQWWGNELRNSAIAPLNQNLKGNDDK
jgi:hypothetical protein